MLKFKEKLCIYSEIAIVNSIIKYYEQLYFASQVQSAKSPKRDWIA